jgi:hypothetical protein
MQVIQYNATVFPPSLGSTGSLAVDLDGLPGAEVILFSRSIQPSMTTSPGTFVWIRRMAPGIRFPGELRTDSILYHVDTTLAYLENETLPWRMHVIREQGCSLDGASSVLEVRSNVYRPFLYAEGLVLDTLAALPADSILLDHGDRTYNSPLTYLNDSTRIHYTTYYRNSNCFQAPIQEIFHLGFVLNGLDGPRHGFMRLELLNGLQLRIHYVAVAP